MPIPKPKSGEQKDEFISRCMGDDKMVTEFTDEAQRYRICLLQFDGNKQVERYKAITKISFDYDGVLSTKKGKELALSKIKEADIYIIAARHHRENLLKVADEIGIKHSRVFNVGSNKIKIEKIKELRIDTHYDNNPNVIKELKSIGKLFN